MRTRTLQTFLFNDNGPTRRSLIAVALLWIATYGLSLTYPSARFWDDWLSHSETVRFAIGANPAPWRESFETTLIQFWPGLFRVITFLVFPTLGLLLWQIMQPHSQQWSSETRFWIATLFVFLPANSARIAWINFSYTTSLLAFFVAWLVLLRWRSWFGLAAAVVLFFYSFRTASLILFLTLPLTQFVYLSIKQRVRLTRIVIPPVALLLLAVSYLPLIHRMGYGYQPGYISISPSTTLRAIMILGVLSVPVAHYLVTNLRNNREHSNFLLRAGFLVLGIGVFPYVVTGNLSDISSFLVGFVPGFSDWDSRHQLLMPLGLSMTLVGSSIYAVPEYRNAILLVALSVFSALNLSFNVEYKVDALKQEAIIEELRKDPEVGDWRYVMFKDGVDRLNARGRSINSYEERGWIIQAGGDQNVVVVDAGNYPCLEPIAGTRIDVNSPNPSKLNTLIRDRIDIKIASTRVLLCP